MGPVMRWSSRQRLQGRHRRHEDQPHADRDQRRDEADRHPRAERPAAEVVFGECIDLREKTTLLELRDVLGHAAAVVGVDGGTLHLAGTTDVPIVFARARRCRSTATSTAARRSEFHGSLRRAARSRVLRLSVELAADVAALHRIASTATTSAWNAAPGRFHRRPERPRTLTEKSKCPKQRQRPATPARQRRARRPRHDIVAPPRAPWHGIADADGVAYVQRRAGRRPQDVIKSLQKRREIDRPRSRHAAQHAAR
jgi:hypothetical protein